MPRTDLGNGWWELGTGAASEIETCIPLIAGFYQERANTEWQEMMRQRFDFAMTGRFVRQEAARFDLVSYIDGAGATWEVQLYNVTDAAELALITVAGVAPANQSISFSLPYAAKMISLRARQTGGTAHDLNVIHAMIGWSSVL